MKIFVIVLGALVALICLLLLIALFIKTEYKIYREVVISRPRNEVYSYIRNLKNQDHYSKWVMTDPSMKKEFKGEDGNVGFIYAWDSNDKNVGKGEQEIVNLVDGERVDAVIRFIKPFEGIANTSMQTESVSENQTKVSWSMKGESRYPMNLMNPFMDQLLGKDLQTSLATLKSNLEK